MSVNLMDVFVALFYIKFLFLLQKLYILTISTGKRELIDVGGASISSCVFQPSKGKYLYMHAVNSIEPQCILQYDLDNQKLRVLHKSAECPVDAAYLSVPTKETFAVADGVDAYGYYYPPKVGHENLIYSREISIKYNEYSNP